ncbi:hypothetical protein PGB90_006769 [Kerria lacca]
MDTITVGATTLTNRVSENLKAGSKFAVFIPNPKAILSKLPRPDNLDTMEHELIKFLKKHLFQNANKPCPRRTRHLKKDKIVPGKAIGVNESDEETVDDPDVSIEPIATDSIRRRTCNKNKVDEEEAQAVSTVMNALERLKRGRKGNRSSTLYDDAEYAVCGSKFSRSNSEETLWFCLYHL